jgi:HAE1 family hydrophobic/amphiphilic exporter-1
VFVLAVLMVFLILAAQYESWSLPFSVLLGTPLAVFGAFLGLLMRDFELNVFGQIGLVMLIGLAAKTAILIVEFAKLELEQGKPLVEAALNGARLRLRPILMTTLTTVAGMSPLALGLGEGSEMLRPLAVCMVFGLLFSMLVSLLLIPSVYLLAHRARAARELSRSPRPSGAAAGP